MYLSFDSFGLGSLWLVTKMDILIQVLDGIDAQTINILLLHPESEDATDFFANRIAAHVQIGLLGQELVMVPRFALLVISPRTLTKH